MRPLLFKLLIGLTLCGACATDVTPTSNPVGGRVVPGLPDSDDDGAREWDVADDALDGSGHASSDDAAEPRDGEPEPHDSTELSDDASDASTAPEPCTPGETRCAEDTLETCADNGFDWAGTECGAGLDCDVDTCGCVDGACVRVQDCEPEARTCFGDDVERCDETGEWYAFEQSCDAPERVCLDGTCTCAEPTRQCEGECVDTAIDPKHCGECGNECGANEVCQGGVCKCPDPLLACGGLCTDSAEDRENCGACGVRCNAEQSCVDGRCVCPDDDEACGDACADLRTDAANCGACGLECPIDQFCRGAECICISAGLTVCGAECVNTTSNDDHCGSCGNACGRALDCIGGECICGGGLTNCAGECVDTDIRADHCGACGVPCEGTCEDGVCVPPACTCPDLTIWCGFGEGTCLSPQGCCVPFFSSCVLAGLSPCGEE